MKWSEQMRVLQSEDEHYNQLIYDVNENALYINEKLIATLDEQNSLDQNKFWDLKKKYSYIDDKNFLLNCLFKLEEGTSSYGAAEEPKQFITDYYHPTCVRYTKSSMGTVIEVDLFFNNICTFSLITQDNDI